MMHDTQPATQRKNLIAAMRDVIETEWPDLAAKLLPPRIRHKKRPQGDLASGPWGLGRAGVGHPAARP